MSTASEDLGASNRTAYPPVALTTTSTSPPKDMVGWTSITLIVLTFVVILYTLAILAFGWPELLLPSYCALFGLAGLAYLILIISAWRNRLLGYAVTRGVEWHLHAYIMNAVAIVSSIIVYFLAHPVYPLWGFLIILLAIVIDILLFVTVSNVCIQQGLFRESPIYLGLINHFSTTRKLPAVRFIFSHLQTIFTPRNSHWSRMWPRLPSRTQLRSDCDNDSEVKKEPVDIV